MITLSVTVPLAANELIDGDFDSLSVGTAPDDDTPAGAWHFPPAQLNPNDFVGEGNEGTVFSVVPTNSFDPGASGNSLRVNSETPGINGERGVHLANLFDAPLSDDFVFEFETYIPAGGGSGAIYLSRGDFTGPNSRGPQIAFIEGNIIAAHPDNLFDSVGSYSPNEWLSLEVRGSIAEQAYDLFAGPRNGDLTLLADDLPFRAPSPRDFFSRVGLAYFSQIGPTDQYFDNVSLRRIAGDFELVCDGDSDGDCDLDDLASLYDAVGGSGQFDYDGNGIVDSGDIQGWLVEASSAANSANPNANPYVLGDVDLDGVVDSSDLGILLNNFAASAATAGEGVGWAGGDVDADGQVNSNDLGLLLNNFGQTSASAAAVPEPNALALAWLAAIAAMSLQRLKR